MKCDKCLKDMGKNKFKRITTYVNYVVISSMGAIITDNLNFWCGLLFICCMVVIMEMTWKILIDDK